MKNQKYLYSLLFIISLVIMTSCSNEKKAEKVDQKVVEEASDNREFKPYLNDKWIGNAVSYGPYREGQAPGQKGPSEEQITEDLDIISSRWNMIRLYNSDENSRKILEIIKNKNYPIKVMLGIWLENENLGPTKAEENIKNIEDGIKLANDFKDQIIAVSVGNEAQVFWSYHKMNIDKQIKFIRKVRQNITQPITTADDYKFWLADSSKTMADEIDFITTHAHPAWNGLSVSKSVVWLDSVYKDLKNVHPNKTIIIGETGWPTNFNKDKVGDGQQGTLITGKIDVEAQKDFFMIYDKWVNDTKTVSFLFEAFDEPWKGGGEATGPNEVEKHWGIFYENRKAKF